MTTITIDRAVVEQALEALEAMQSYAAAERKGLRICDEAITALRAALAQEQAEPVQEPHRDLRAALQAPGCERLREWVEIGPVQRAALETCVAALALAQEQAEPPGCEHCNHPLYAATKCRVCGKVTEPKGGGNLPPPLQEPAVAENATTQQQLADTPPSDYRRGYWDGFNIGKREGRIEAEDAAKQAKPVQEPVAIIQQLWDIIDDIDTYSDVAKADDKLYRSLVERKQKDRWKTGITTDGYTLNIPLYTAPPRCPNCASLEAQNTELDRKLAELERKPLTDEEIDAEWQKASECAYSSEAVVTTSQFVRLFARAIERALEEKHRA